MSYGKALFGHRLLELARQNPRVDGFAPWQHATGFRPATLWNQPILVGLRNEQGLPPSNFFAGRDAKRELFVVNSTNHEVKNGKIRVWLLTEQGKELPLAEAVLPELAPWKTAVLPVTLRMPEKPIGHAQLRATFSGADGKELSRNFYNVYLGSRAVLTDPVKCAEKVALLDVGSPADVETTGAVLKALAIPYAVIPAAKLDGAFTAAIIPAGLENSEPLKLDARKLDAWLRAGGKLLVLEQPVTSGSVLPESKPVLSPLPFADLVYPQHPGFRRTRPAKLRFVGKPGRRPGHHGGPGAFLDERDRRARSAARQPECRKRGSGSSGRQGARLLDAARRDLPLGPGQLSFDLPAKRLRLHALRPQTVRKGHAARAQLDALVDSGRARISDRPHEAGEPRFPRRR